MKNDYTYELALTMLPGVGCQTQRQLLEIVGSAKELFEMPAKELTTVFGKHKKIVNAIVEKSMFADVEKELKFIEKNKIKILYYNAPEYPQRLNRPGCEDTPILLYSLGNADYNAARTISVVGTRRATVEGVDLTNALIAGLRQEEVTIVSGLALGIDSAAHMAALNEGLPTLGVLGHGLDQIYPSQNRNLAKKIINNGGALLTERCSGTPISPGLFPARNRIIAALSDATVVVEASVKGGALITANIASSYHRELFAFPGRIKDKYSEGCNAIIASGKAMLIRGADDLMTNMGWERKCKIIGKQTSLFPDINGNEKTIYEILDKSDGLTMDQIREHCDLSLPQIATALLGLELKNICRCLPGKIYKTI
ncbi:MAG: DNA-processing protein DprA [Bacteroidales bacterium]|nr:DNA-processing protein DprA [Bacteroidales bacterium]